MVRKCRNQHCKIKLFNKNKIETIILYFLLTSFFQQFFNTCKINIFILPIIYLLYNKKMCYICGLNENKRSHITFPIQSRRPTTLLMCGIFSCSNAGTERGPLRPVSEGFNTIKNLSGRKSQFKTAQRAFHFNCSGKL